MQETWFWSLIWEDSLEEAQQPTPEFLPGASHGQKSLADYSPWGCKGLGTTEQQSTAQVALNNHFTTILRKTAKDTFWGREGTCLNHKLCILGNTFFRIAKVHLVLKNNSFANICNHLEYLNLLNSTKRWKCISVSNRCLFGLSHLHHTCLLDK